MDKICHSDKPHCTVTSCACVTIAIRNTGNRKTLKSIKSSGAFSVGFPLASEMDKIDYMGVETGYNSDKLKDIGYTVTRGEHVYAPVINELKLNFECKVGHTAVVGGHTLISGEIKNILADETILDEKNKIMIQKLDPVIYDEEGMAYYHLGEKLLTPPYKAGTDLKRHLATLR